MKAVTAINNPNRTTRKTVGRKTFVLDGYVIRTYTRDRFTRVPTLTKTEDFHSRKKAKTVFNCKGSRLPIVNENKKRK